MPKTSSSPRPTWDIFADEILPIIGLPSLRYVLQLDCPMLSPLRVDYWAARFNSANDRLDNRFSDEFDGLTGEERDGTWYDQMKSVALECLSEIDQKFDSESTDRPRGFPG